MDEGVTGELKITGVRPLGELLGIGKTLAAELAKESWFPKKALDGSWSTLEVQKAYADYKKREETAGQVPVPRTEELDELRRTLATSKDPEAIGQAHMELVARSLAHADSVSTRDVVAMKSALEELRKGAAGYLELRKKKGEVIERDVAKAVMGQFGRRLVAVLERYEVQLPQKIEAWLADPLFTGASAEERARVVRAWSGTMAHDVRKTEAGDIERMVVAEVKEQA